MRRYIKRIISDNRGFTIVEMLIAFAIAGILGAATVTATVHVLNSSDMSNNSMTALNNSRLAGDWLTKDGRMAETVSPSAIALSPDFGSFTLTWHDFYEISYTVVYTINDRNELVRTYTAGSGSSVSATVASNITAINGTYSSGIINLTGVTAVADSGSNQKTVTTDYQIKLRNG